MADAYFGFPGPTGIWQNSLALNNPSIVGVNTSIQLANNDLYTVPAGKRAVILSNKMYGGGGLSVFLQVKIGGSGAYRKLMAAVASDASGIGTTTSIAQCGYVFEAGDIISVNHSGTGSAVNHVLSILLFNNTSGLKTAVIPSMANGANVLYTCPTGKQAMFPNFGTSGLFMSGGNSTVGFVYNGSGGSRSVSMYLVPNAGTPDATNIYDSGVAVADGARGSLTPEGVLGAGDTVNVNTDSGTATQTAWVTVYEF